MLKTKIKYCLLPLMIAVLILCGLMVTAKTSAAAETAEKGLQYGYNFSTDGGVDGLNFDYRNNQSNKVQSNANGIVFSNEHLGGTGARVANSFGFVAAQDDEVVFDTTFSGYFGVGHSREVNLSVGLSFGLPSATASFAEGTFIGIGNPYTTVIKNGVQTETHERFPAYAEAFNERISLRVVAYKNGNVVVYRGYTMAAGSQNIQEVLATYNGYKVDGYIAFGVYNLSDFSGKYDFTITDFIVKGKISANVTPQVNVEINESEFAYAYVGMPALPLSSVVRVAPSGAGFSREVKYSVISGNAAVTNDGKLNITGAGQITLRAQSVANQNCFDEASFLPKAEGSYACESYTVADDFTNYDQSIWQLSDPKGRASFGRGFSVSGDYADGQYNGAKAVSKVRYSSLGNSSIVFDMSVRSYGYYRYNYADKWGFMFGLPEQNSSLTDDGVGFLWMSPVGMGLMIGGRELAPEFVNPYNMGGVVRELGSAVYVDTYNEAFVIRLIAYRDGTLELYRTQAGHESLGKLKARWSGLDFNGYVALSTYSSFVNAEVTGQSGANFREFSISGSALDDGNTAVTALSIDRDIFIDVAQVEPELKLKAFVTAAPSFDKYKQVDWEVVSGAATITDGKICFSEPGTVKVAAKARENHERADIYTFEVKDFKVNSVEIDASIFKNLTDFTQPILLSSAVNLDCSLRTPKYNAVDWQVVSGPALVQAGRLRIIGTGKVTLRAVARFDTTKTDTITFSVKGYYRAKFPVLAVVLPIVGAVLIAGVITTIILIKKRKKASSKTDNNISA